MNNNFDDLLNGAFGKRRSYTTEEIDAALKRKKEKGGTVLDNLAATTGRTLKRDYDMSGFGSVSTPNKEKSGQSAKTGSAKTGSGASLEEGLASVTNANNEALADVSEMIAGLNQNLKDEFDVQKPFVAKKADFSGLEELLNQQVYGQEEYIHKLVIAFRRPFVMPEEDEHARNTIFISGKEDTGRHHALGKIAVELKNRGMISGEQIAVIDLSLYQDQSARNVMLQDLYGAIKAPGQIIVFENYETCHISCLAYVNELFTTGKCQLKERYTLQKGQLVNVQNSFASEAVSYFSAKGKYLVLMSTKGTDQLASVLGAPFVNALGDICETTVLSKEALVKVARDKLKEMMDTVKLRLAFAITAEEEALADAIVSSAPAGDGLSGVLQMIDKLLKSLVQLRLEKDYPENEPVALSVEEQKIVATIQEEKMDLLAVLPSGYSGALDQVKAEMEKIVGLTEIKEYIFSLEEYYGVQKRRKEAGLKASEVNKHMIFTGNPGTGKTTIARIVSQYLKAIGVLTGGQLVEVTRADLVGRYVGHTAPLTNQVIQSAIGGVLFIDEAYSLYRGKEDSFGLEAIDTLVKGIEDNRDNLIVILAGYSKEMEIFLTANSGLKSRFPNIIHFPDYTGEELLAIAELTAKSKGYVLEETVKPELLSYFNQVQATDAREAGNGRLVRNKIEEAILNQSRRVAVDKEADLSLLMSGDFELNK